MPLIGAIVLFVVFAINVALGSAGVPVFLNDVAEMLVLLGTAVFFVFAILKSEAAAKK